METTLEPSMQTKPIEYGDGLIVRNLDDKILITAERRTHLQDGNFILNAQVIKIEAGAGIKISSKGHDTLVISCDLTQLEAKVYDMQVEMDKRLKVIEQVFTKILKQAKN